ncbi:transcription antitermination factor NusB [Candidatus Omnitrophota bacterium]
MRKRTKARECALKILYQTEIGGQSSEDSLKVFWQANETSDASVREFATQLVVGVLEHVEPIDEVISKCAANWQLKRMAVIDRNILRMATYELLFLDDIPLKVSINEAVDLAKKFGDVESGRFVNGIIDKVKETSCQEKPN